MTDANHWPPGWYPDPWVGGQHRYWDGESWTADAFQSGPRVSATGAPAAPLPHSDQPPQPPSWIPAERPAPPPPLPAPIEPEPPDRRLSGAALFSIMLAVGLIAGFLIALGLSSAFHHQRSSAAAPPVTLPTTAPPVNPLSPSTTSPGPSGTGGSIPGGANQNCSSGATGAPNATVSGLGLQQSDVPSTATVQTIPCGDQVGGQTTLDLCNGTFPSESLRTARLQVEGVDAANGAILSTEAVLYSDAGAGAQALSELRAVAAACPKTPVSSPVGEPTVATSFRPAPDAAWPHASGVDRVAYDFDTTDATGTRVHSMAVYLRRGKVLLGVYMPNADGPVLTVGGKSTVSDIVAVFEGRLAALPASAVSP